MSILPKQKIPRAQKTKGWGKDTINAIIEGASFGGMGDASRQNLFMLYDAYWGRLNGSRFTYVTNPNSLGPGKIMNYPAKLRNYNIIKPNIDTLVGEKARRPFEYLVTVMNADTETRQNEAVQKQVLNTLTQQFINNLNAEGVPTGQESQPVEPPAEVVKTAKQNYRDARAIMGQEALSYLKDYLDLPDKFQEGFLERLITGERYTYKCARRDDAEYENVPPGDLWYPRSQHVKYVEDADRVVRRKRMTVNQVVDQFYDLLTPDEIDALENGHTAGVDGMFLPNVSSVSNATSNSGELEVMHVCWKSFTQLWILSFYDELGELQQMPVDETYKPVENETLEKYWINEWWEGYRIDNRFWVGIQPCETQRRSMSNLSVCKGPYNGYRSESSPVMDMLPYQDLYNIFHYRLELSIAKNKDKIALIEINMIPKGAGWDVDKFMYYADANGFAFIDSTAEGKDGKQSNFSQWQVLDMSLGQYIAAQYDLLRAVKQECADIIGFNDQRKGQVLASAGNGATERAVFQSSIISEELFRQEEKFQEKELQGLLDLSKHMWRDGKKASYMSSDYRQEVLSIDGDDYQEADLGVFAKNGGEEGEKVKAMQNIMQAYMQNGGDLLTVAEVLDQKNFAQIKQLVGVAEEKRRAFEQQAQQAQSEQQQQMIDAQREAAEQLALDNRANQDRLFAHQKELKAMEISGKILSTKDTDGDGTPDWAEEQTVAVKREQIASNERIANQQANLQEKEIQVKREKIQADKAKAKPA